MSNYKPFIAARQKLALVASIVPLTLIPFTTASAASAAPADTPPPYENLSTLHVKSSALKPFETVLRQNAADARHAPGNISFTIFQSLSTPSTLYVLEQWSTEAAYKVHMQQPALLAMHKAAQDDLDGPISHMRIAPVSPGDDSQPKEITHADQTSNVLVFLSVKSAAEKQFRTDIANVTPTFRAAPGNISFDVFEDTGHADSMVQLERWTSDATHQANLKRPIIGTIRADYALTLATPMMNGRVLLKDITNG
ncbi:Quinol monooxygenase YgiN [Paraburkholderia fungorum]|uniref:Quinol monooxygenase YgiN n=1 Tax=Paraburkholderia fungorum TaxID=134537 RepID=A0A1H1JPZ5_9BURK|nr:antibiotic biosynthesis monooxygenase [Paraburkholderia fungorum]SDR52083.1 Quinol monooxygenase YgiN [Paraburkholderia fungorum]